MNITVQDYVFNTFNEDDNCNYKVYSLVVDIMLYILLGYYYYACNMPLYQLLGNFLKGETLSF
jgi:hypothetical protein